MKNIVFQVNIKGRRHRPEFDLSTQSWKKWADKNNCEVLVLDQFIRDESEMKANWQKWYIFDLLEANEIEYDQILVVDADTIVHPDCPNFFEMTNHEYSAVVNNGSFEWVRHSVDSFSKELFNGEVPFDIWEYINCGFQIVNKKHKPFFEYVIKFYNENQDRIRDSIEKIQAGTDQTIINFLLRQQNIKINYLPIAYNLQDLFTKQLLYFNEQCWWPDKLIFDNCGYVFHFNAIPQNDMNRDAAYWIERSYKEFYG